MIEATEDPHDEEAPEMEEERFDRHGYKVTVESPSKNEMPEERYDRHGYKVTVESPSKKEMDEERFDRHGYKVTVESPSKKDMDEERFDRHGNKVTIPPPATELIEENYDEYDDGSDEEKPMMGQTNRASSRQWSTVSDENRDEVSLMPIARVLGLHFFATAMTVPALPSLLLQILNGNIIHPFPRCWVDCMTERARDS